MDCSVSIHFAAYPLIFFCLQKKELGFGTNPLWAPAIQLESALVQWWSSVVWVQSDYFDLMPEGLCKASQKVVSYSWNKVISVQPD